MKNKISKRLLCLLCCFSLTLGVFAYKPAKAEASFVSGAAALGCAVLISTIIGTTADMAFDDVVTENIGNVIDPFVWEFVEFEGNVFENVTDLYTTIVADSNPLTAGVLALSDEAGALIARFINWLQTDKGLEEGGEPVVVYNTDVIYDTAGRPVLSPIDTYPECLPYLLNYGVTYTLGNGTTIYGERVDTSAGSNQMNITVTASDGRSFTLVNSNSILGQYESLGYSLVYKDYTDKVYLYNLRPTSDNILFEMAGGPKSDASSYFGPYTPNDITLQPKPEFQTIPNEIPAGQALTVNTGLTDISFEDEQAAADSIFSAALDGTLSPTVAVEDAADVPGTDTDTDDSILSWTKKIWQAVTDLPADIASAIGGAISSALEAVFAPDAALINEMTTAFSAKFGFVDTLKQVGDDFFGMTPDTQPPVVYIHLEDAEGAYNYGGTVKALDMTWYQRYKADVDRILGGFLWIAYLWMLFRRAPDILAGAGLVLADNSYIDSVQGENGERWTFRRSKHL